jgi:uncharacterized protein involved in outer membrane biogenesis
MKHLRPLPERFVIALLLFIGVYHILAGHIIPDFLLRRLHQYSKNILSASKASISFPNKIILSNVTFEQPRPGTNFSIKKATLLVRWISFKSKKIWLKKANLEGLEIAARRAQSGRFYFPRLQAQASASTVNSDKPTKWQFLIDSLEISDGTINYLDEKPEEAFQGTLSDLSIAAGPISFPITSDKISLAMQGTITGFKELSSAIYCSGWMDLASSSFDSSCKLDALKLAAFQPYYPNGPLKKREYDATVAATGAFSARENQLNGKLQLRIDGLSEEDLSVLTKLSALSKPLANFKNPSKDSEAKLSGEIQISGPLNNWKEWKLQLSPGNEIVQELLNPIIERGKGLNIKVGSEKIPVDLATSTEAVMSGIEEASKTVQEDLKLLAPAAAAEQESPKAEAEGAAETNKTSAVEASIKEQEQKTDTNNALPVDTNSTKPAQESQPLPENAPVVSTN